MYFKYFLEFEEPWSTYTDVNNIFINISATTVSQYCCLTTTLYRQYTTPHNSPLFVAHRLSVLLWKSCLEPFFLPSPFIPKNS